jgi:O-antigen/teichoic acid export membrane protein
VVPVRPVTRSYLHFQMTHRVRPDRYFRPAPYRFDAYTDNSDDLDRHKIARSGVRGSVATLTGSSIKFLFGSATTIVLAHLLTPVDFGVVAMVTAISGFADLMRDLGLSFAVVQTPTLSREQASTLFWYSSGLGAISALGLVALGPLIGKFYHQSHISAIILVVAIGLFISSLGSQHIALLDRSLGFTRVMVSDVVSTSLSCVVASVIAVAGGGYWALVALVVTQSFLRTVLAWINVRWLPGRPARFRTVSSLVFFGSNLLATQLLNYFSRNLDNVVVGRFFGPKVLGQYAQAYQLLLLPLQQVNAPLQRVAVPLLSRSAVDSDLYREYYRMAIRLMTWFLIPVFCVSAILANGLVHLVLGPQWKQCASLFRILCIAGVTQSLGYSTSWLFISTGQGGRQLKWAFLSRPLLIASFFIGVHWGVRGLALSYSLMSSVLVVPSFVYAMKNTPAHMIDLLAGMKELVIMLPIVSFAAFFVDHKAHSAGLSISVSFLAAAAACTITYFGAWWLIPSCRHTALRLFRIMRSVEAPRSTGSV